MPTAITDTEDVCAFDDLAKEIGGHSALSNLGDSSLVLAALQGALDDVVDALRNRVPPVRESELSDVTELKLPVMYGALERLYRQNATTGDAQDINARKSRDYATLRASTTTRLRPTLTGAIKASPGTIALHRR